MKITKQQLESLIKEEFASMQEDEEGKKEPAVLKKFARAIASIKKGSEQLAKVAETIASKNRSGMVRDRMKTVHGYATKDLVEIIESLEWALESSRDDVR